MKSTPIQVRKLAVSFSNYLIKAVRAVNETHRLKVKSVEPTETGGYSVVIDTGNLLHGSVELEIWCDEFHGEGGTGIWLGLASTREKDILPYKDDPAIGEVNIIITDRWISDTNPPTIREGERRPKTKVFFENYGRDEQYLGRYLSLSSKFSGDAVYYGMCLAEVFFAQAAILKWATHEDPYTRYVNEAPQTVQRNENSLVGAFCKFMDGKGWRCTPELITDDNKRIDVVCSKDGSTLYCEAKHCTPELCRFAIRQAMGQLLDYSQDSKQLPRKMVVLNERPSKRDLALATNNGFDVAYCRTRNGAAFEIHWSDRSIGASQ